MSNLNFAAERLGRALYHLAGTGTHQKRQRSAFMSFRPLRPDDFKFHPKLKKSYEEIMRRLTVVSDEQKNHAPSKLEKMTNEEAAELTEMLVDLYVLTKQRAAKKNQNRASENSKQATEDSINGYCNTIARFAASRFIMRGSRRFIQRQRWKHLR